jgi:hypothetical protein
VLAAVVDIARDALHHRGGRIGAKLPATQRVVAVPAGPRICSIFRVFGPDQMRSGGIASS